MNSNEPYLLIPANREYIDTGEGKLRLHRVMLPNIAIWVWLPLVIIGIALIPWTLFVHSRVDQLESTGTGIWAEYVSRRISESDDSTMYLITVSYTVNGETYRREFSVNRRTYDSADNGEPHRVTYAASNPRVATLGDPNRRQFWGLVIVSIIWNGLVWGIWLVIYTQNLGYRRRITNNPKLIPGTLITQAYQRGNGTRLIPYDFRSPRTENRLTGRVPVREKVWQQFYATIPPDLRKKMSDVPVIVAYCDDRTHTLL